MIYNTDVVKKATKIKKMVESLNRKTTTKSRTKVVKTMLNLFYNLECTLFYEDSPNSRFFLDKLSYIKTMLVEYIAMDNSTGVAPRHIIDDYLIIQRKIIIFKMRDWIAFYVSS